MGRGLRSKQSDGRKPVPHIITGIVAVALSLGVPYFTHFDKGSQGPAGPAGSSVVQAGICTYFGPDGKGTNHFQVFTPNADGTCQTGHYVKVAVRR